MELYSNVEQFQEALARLTEEARYQDTVLVCQDESVRACRLFLALAFPLLEKVLEERHTEQELCILLPDHTSEDINIALNEFFTDMSSFSLRKAQHVAEVAEPASAEEDDTQDTSFPVCEEKDDVKSAIIEVKISQAVEVIEELSFTFDEIEDVCGVGIYPKVMDMKTDVLEELSENMENIHAKLLESAGGMGTSAPSSIEESHFTVCDQEDIIDSNLTIKADFVKNTSEIVEFKLVSDLEEIIGEEKDDNNLAYETVTKSEMLSVVPGKYVCDICNKSSSSQGNLSRHKMRKHKIPICRQRNWVEGKFPCDICGKPTASPGNLNLHKQRKHGVTIARKCHFCKEVFNSTDELKDHKKRYYGGEGFQCPEENCSTTIKLTNSAAFMDHLNRHWERMDYSCDECGKVFTVKAWLKSHLSTHVDPSIKPYVCHICAKTYKNNNLLRTHMEVHLNANRFKCDFCDKGFPFKASLTEHLVCHTKERRISCTYCELMFGRRQDARVHEARVHTGVRKHKCTYCEKTFVESTRLKRHVRIHTGEMPFSCSKCGKGHNQRENRNKHQVSCTGDLKII